jgi:SAM-dependent methyltransferase
MHTYLKCRQCGLIYVADLPTHGDLMTAYERVHRSCYQVQHKKDWEPWREHKHKTLDALGLDEWNHELQAPPRALDLGCGEGQMLRVLQERGWEAWGVEVNSEFVQKARRQGLHVLEAPVEHATPPGLFHLVLMNHLIEHLRRPLEVLRQIHGWLHTDGRFIVETPLLPDFDNIDHLFCFSRESLELSLRMSAFAPFQWFQYVDSNYGHHNLACCAKRV